MSSRILVHRKFKETLWGTEIKYLMSNHQQVFNCDLPTLKNNQSIYIFCHPIHETYISHLIVQYFRPKLQIKNIGLTQLDVADHHIMAYMYTNQFVPITTNANILGFTTSNGLDDTIQMMSVFRLTFRRETVCQRVYADLMDNTTIQPFHILKPYNIEMEMILDEIFSIKNIEGVDQMFMEINKVSLTKKISKDNMTKILQIVNPLQTYLCFFEETLLVKHMPCENEDNNKILIDTFIRNIPKMLITLVMSDERNPFLYDSTIEQLHITIEMNDDVIHYAIVCLPEEMRQYFQPINKAYISFVSTEYELLEKFIEMYCLGGMLANGNLNLHWIVNEQYNMVFTRIIDRAIINNLFLKMRSSCVACGDIIILNPYCIVLPSKMISHKKMEPSLSYVKPKFYQSLKLLRDLKPEYVNKPKVDENFMNYMEYNLDTMGIKFNQLKDYGNNGRVFIAGPRYYCIEHFNANHHWFTTYIPKSFSDLIDYINDIKVSIFDLHSITPSLQSYLFLFYRYLKEGIFLFEAFTSNGQCCAMLQDNQSQLCNYMSTNGKEINIIGTQHQLTYKYTKRLPLITSFINLNDLMIMGGIIRTSYNCYTNLSIVSLDFISFYPTIVTHFQLDFNNQCILSGQEYLNLIKILPNGIRPYLKLWAIYTYEEIFDDESIILTHLYLLIIPNINETAFTFDKIFSLYTKKNIKSKLHKDVFNTILGCLKNNKFKYRNSSLLAAIHFLGQRLLIFFDFMMDQLVEGFNNNTNLYDSIEGHWIDFKRESYMSINGAKRDKKPISKYICHINTDGFTCHSLLRSGFAEYLNQHIQIIFKNNNNNNETYLRLRPIYTTAFQIDFGPSMYIYYDDRLNIFKGPNEININQDICQKIKNALESKSLIDITSTLNVVEKKKNYRLITLFYYNLIFATKYKHNTTPDILIQRDVNFKWMCDFYCLTLPYYIDVICKDIMHLDAPLRQICNIFFNKF